MYKDENEGLTGCVGWWNSAFDMLRFPKLRTRDFVEVIPELGRIGEGVLERVDIDGTSIIYHTPSTLSSSSLLYAYNPCGSSVICTGTMTGRYHSYLSRQQAELRNFTDEESLLLSPGMDYSVVQGLSSEEKERLSRVRPRNIGQAKRMEGMTPKGIVMLLRYAKRTWGREGQGGVVGEVAGLEAEADEVVNAGRAVEGATA